MITDEPYFFDRKNHDIKKILKKQGNMTCRDSIPKEALLSAIHAFDYGYAILKNKAIMGKTIQSINDKYKLVAYVLFRIVYLNGAPSIFIESICSDVNYKNEMHGKILLNLCIQYGKDNKINYIELHSLNEIKLIKWYEKYGFNIVRPIKMKNEIKVYIMELHI